MKRVGKKRREERKMVKGINRSDIKRANEKIHREKQYD